MRHHKKRTLRKRKGGAWYDPRTWFEKKPEEALQAAPAAAEQAVQDLTGAPKESSGVPGGMPASAPAAAVLGGRRKTKRRKHKSRR